MNPLYYHLLPKPAAAVDNTPVALGHDPVPIAQAVIRAVLQGRPPAEAFEPALNNTRGAIRFMNPVNRDVSLPKNTRLEAPVYNFREIDKVVRIESMVSRAFWTIISHIMPGEDSFHFESVNQEAADYIERRLWELTLPIKGSPYSLLRKIVENVVRKSNAVVWMRRDRDASEDAYLYLGEKRSPAKCIEVLDLSQLNVARHSKDNSFLGWHLSNVGMDKLIPDRDAYLIRYMQITSDDLLGMPFLLPVLDDILSLRRLEEMVDLAMGKATFPLYHLAIGDDKVSPAIWGNGGADNEISRAKAAWQAMAPEGVYISPGWHKIEVVQPNHVGDFTPYLNWYRDRIFMGLLVDGPTMGVGSTSNRNTANTMSDVLLTKIRDFQTEISTQFSRYVIRELLVEGGYDPAGPDNVHLVFKDHDREGRNADENQVMGKYQSNLMSHDEARRALGKQPMSEEEINNKTFIALTSRKQQEVDASKAAIQAKNRPSNQHGTSPSKPKAAKRKDSWDRAKNTFLSTHVVNPQAAAAVLQSQARGIIRDMRDELAGMTTLTHELVKGLEDTVMGVVRDILSAVQPTMTADEARNLFDARRWRLDAVTQPFEDPNEDL